MDGGPDAVGRGQAVLHFQGLVQVGQGFGIFLGVVVGRAAIQVELGRGFPAKAQGAVETVQGLGREAREMLLQANLNHIRALPVHGNAPAIPDVGGFGSGNQGFVVLQLGQGRHPVIQLNVAQGVAGVGVVGFNVQGGVKTFQGFLPLLGFPIGPAQLVAGIRVFRLQDQGFLKILDGQGVPLQEGVGQAPGVVKVGVIRFQVDSPVIIPDGFVVVLQPAIDPAPGVKGGRIVRIRIHGGGVVGNSLGKVAGVAVSHAPVVPGFGKAGIAVQGQVKVSQGGRPIALLPGKLAPGQVVEFVGRSGHNSLEKPGLGNGGIRVKLKPIVPSHCSSFRPAAGLDEIPPLRSGYPLILNLLKDESPATERKQSRRFRASTGDGGG